MKLSDDMLSEMENESTWMDPVWFPERWIEQATLLEAENERLKLDRNLYDKGWDKALGKLRTYRDLLSEVGDYFKHIGMDSPARLASKVFDALLAKEPE